MHRLIRQTAVLALISFVPAFAIADRHDDSAASEDLRQEGLEPKTKGAEKMEEAKETVPQTASDEDEEALEPKAKGARVMEKAKETVPGAGTADKYKPAEVTMHAVTKDSVGDSIGSIRIRYTDYGVVFDPDLTGLTPGLHGFHMHENAACGPTEKDGEAIAAGAAGGHYNPGGGGHNGPYAKGHKGDLPALTADEQGNVTLPVLAPRLTAEDIRGHSLIIHRHGDNYSDKPEPLGGGGPRVACGVM